LAVSGAGTKTQVNEMKYLQKIFLSIFFDAYCLKDTYIVYIKKREEEYDDEEEELEELEEK
jgi:hypothetical protein